MKLDCVLRAVNENKLYIDFVPYFIKMWNKLYPNVDVKIVLIAKYIPENLKEYEKNIILFEPIDEISTAFISQYIRLLYPALLTEYKGGIMITDIDNVPLSNTYFTNNIKYIDTDKWINYRNWKTENQISMAWQITTYKNWSEVFKIKTINDVKKKLIERNKTIKYNGISGKSGWFTDQIDLYKYVMDWNNQTGKYIFLNDEETKFNRLDRKKIKNNIRLSDKLIRELRNKKYTDYHCARPFDKYEKINNDIYNITIK